MCLHCVDQITPQQHHDYLMNVQQDPSPTKYESMTVTHLHYLLDACLGFYGHESYRIALTLLNNYLHWCNSTITSTSHPQTRIIYPLSNLQQVYHWCHSRPPHETLDHASRRLLLQQLFTYLVVQPTSPPPSPRPFCQQYHRVFVLCGVSILIGTLCFFHPSH